MHSMAAGKVVKEQGGENDLLARIANDPLFGTTLEELKALMHPANFVGRAPQQTEEFITEHIRPILDRCADELGLRWRSAFDAFTPINSYHKRWEPHWRFPPFCFLLFKTALNLLFKPIFYGNPFHFPQKRLCEQKEKQQITGRMSQIKRKRGRACRHHRPQGKRPEKATGYRPEIHKPAE